MHVLCPYFCDISDRTTTNQWLRAVAVTLMTVNSFDTLQQSMKLESYLHISDSPLGPGVKATEGACDQIDSPVERKASDIGNIWGVHKRDPGKPTGQRAAAESGQKTDNQRGVSTRHQVRSSPLMMSGVTKPVFSQLCQANVATLCNIWTIVFSLYEVRYLKMCHGYVYHVNKKTTTYF